MKNEFFKLLKTYPHIFLGLFIIYSLSYNKSYTFLITAAISVVAIHCLLGKFIYDFAIWTYYPADEAQESQVLPIYVWLFICLYFSIVILILKIILSPIWDILSSNSTYHQKILFILNDKTLTMLAILILIVRMAHISAGMALKLNGERLERRISNSYK